MFNVFRNKATLLRDMDMKFMAHEKRVRKIILNNEYTKTFDDGPRNYLRIAKEAYLKNETVYAGINRIARAISQLEFKVIRNTARGEQKIVPNHPILKLLQAPNDYQGKEEYFQKMIMQWYLSGMAFQQVTKAGGTPKRLFLIRPDRMEARINNQKTRVDFKYDYNGEGFIFKPGEVSYIRFPHPLEDIRGLSPLIPAAFSVDLSNNAKSWNNNSFVNSAVPSGALKVKGTVDKTNEKRYKQMLKRIQGAVNKGKPLLLDDGADWVNLGMNALEMDFINGQNLSTKQISLALGVPTVLLGDSDSSTYNNVKEAKRDFYTDTIIPNAKLIVNEFNNWLMPMYGNKNDRLEIILEEIPALQEDKALLVDRATNLYNSGIITRAEALKMNNLPFLDQDKKYKTTFSDLFEQVEEPKSATVKKLHLKGEEGIKLLDDMLLESKKKTLKFPLKKMG